MAEVLNSVPDGWEVKALGEVSRIELGKTPSRSNSIYWDTEKQTGNVWLSISDLPKQNLAVASDSKEYLSDEGASISKIVPRETLMVSFKLTLGRLAYAGKDLYTNEAIASLYLFNPNQFAENYLYYYLTFYDWDKAAEGKEKIKGKTLNKKILKELEILVPPLPEQERIVGVLDEAFEGIATATAQAEKNLQNARELFQSVLQSAFSQKGDDWGETTLGEVCNFLSGGTPSKKNSSYWNGVIPWISGKDMKSDRLSDAALHISEIAIQKSASKLAPVGSLLILVRGMGLANGIAVAELTKACAFNQDIKALLVFESVFPRFLLRSLQAYFEENDILQRAAHGTLKINLDDLKAVRVALPPFADQQTIVKKLDALSEETKRLETIYQRKLDALAELKQSLLQRAFAGEL